MEEKFLYHIWDAGHLLPGLKTASGKELKINYSGQFNTQRGPDFMNAVLSIDGETTQGAVEIHQSTLDWRRHNHQEDHHYNCVILHAVLNHNTELPYTQKEDGQWVEILELKSFLSEDIKKLLENYQETSSSARSRYCERLSAIDREHLISILNQHGMARFHSKVKRFNASLSLSDFEQILYEGMLEAAGYDKNKLNMLQLAQSIPLRKLKQWQQDGMQRIEMAAILACGSGLAIKSNSHKALVQQLTHVYEKQRFAALNLDIDWQLFRIRPPAHPLPRLLAITAFLYPKLEAGLLHAFLSRVEHDSPNSELRYKRFRQLFGENGDSNLSSTVIDNIYLNIYLPIIYLYAHKLGHSEMERTILESWSGFKALADNYLIRYMQNHLNPSQQSLIRHKSLYQQGLIDIFYRYCRYHQCPQCRQEDK